MKRKYQKQVDKLTDQLTDVCVEISKLLKKVSIDGSVETEFDFVEKDKQLYYDIRFILPVFKIPFK